MYCITKKLLQRLFCKRMTELSLSKNQLNYGVDSGEYVWDKQHSIKNQPLFYTFPYNMKSRWFSFTRHCPNSDEYINQEKWKSLGVIVLSYQVEKVKLKHLQGYVEVDDYYTVSEIRNLLKFPNKNGHEDYGYFDVPVDRVKSYWYTRKERSRIEGPFGFGLAPLVP